MTKQAVGVALSGGVDSTMAAHMLLRQGFTLTGFFMELAQPDLEAQRLRASEIADRLGIPLRRVDLRREFDSLVLSYLAANYRLGLTPNPCMVCNREIKFGLLWQAMARAGMEAMATGHYAILRQEESVRLYKGVDEKKDQSYFLAALSHEQLARMIFPLGEYCKPQVFAMAEAAGFTGFSGESQDVCFLAERALGDYLADKLGEQDGPFLTTSDKEIGRHRGIFRYTIGQRRGLELPDATPWYVVALDGAKNAVIVGKNEELFRHDLVTAPAHWLNRPADFAGDFTVKIRANHAGAPARLNETSDGCLDISFSEPQRAVAPGQFAVIYRDDEVLGSGVIAK